MPYNNHLMYKALKIFDRVFFCDRYKINIFVRAINMANNHSGKVISC